jgi:hypothetical protein
MAELQFLRLGDALQQGQTLAMNNYRLSEAARGAQAKSGLEGALRAGTPEAMQTYQQQFPIEAAQHQEQKAESRDKQLKRVIDQVSAVEKLTAGLEDITDPAEGQTRLSLVRQQAEAMGLDTSKIPTVWNEQTRAFIKQHKQQALGFKGQAEMELREFEKGYKTATLEETKRHNRATERAGGEGGKPPAGYRWGADGNLEAIPGGPATKPTESQQKQLTGVTNLQNAVQEYLSQLEGWGALDIANPNARARMGTKYNNMMLQAKEAYNLGVLNGPDFEILQRVITDPRTLTGAITSKEALGDQARELGRIMSSVGQTAATGQVRAKPGDKQKPAAPNIDDLLRKYGGS